MITDIHMIDCNIDALRKVFDEHKASKSLVNLFWVRLNEQNIYDLLQDIKKRRR
ncbi:MAG TPA: hypothetical protein VMV86_06315 [Methanosarcinales archaeon]|nr:hypothetical protein [Methanosarcinales archaeon]